MKQKTMNDLLRLIIPYIADPEDRRKHLRVALADCDLLEQIDWEGTPRKFAVRFIEQADAYGSCREGRSVLIDVLRALPFTIGQRQRAELLSRSLNRTTQEAGTAIGIERKRIQMEIKIIEAEYEALREQMIKTEVANRNTRIKRRVEELEVQLAKFNLELNALD